MNKPFMKLKQFLILSLTIFAFMGCTIGMKNVSKDFTFKDGEKKGLVIVTIAHHERLNNATYTLINKNNPKDMQMVAKTRMNADDFDKNDYEATQKVIALDEGEYYFKGWSLMYTTSCGYECTQMNTIFGRDIIPFKVKAGEVIYLGEFRMQRYHPPKNGNKFGHTLKNNRKRDLKLFAKKMKNFSVKDVKIRLGKTTRYLSDDELEAHLEEAEKLAKAKRNPFK